MAGGWSAVSSMSSWMRSSASGICPARGVSASASVTDRSHPRRHLPSTDPITTMDYDANGSTRPPVRQLPIRMHRARTDQGMNPDRGRRRKNQQRASSPTPRRPPRTQGTRDAFHPSPSRTCPAARPGSCLCAESSVVSRESSVVSESDDDQSQYDGTPAQRRDHFSTDD